MVEHLPDLCEAPGITKKKKLKYILGIPRKGGCRWETQEHSVQVMCNGGICADTRASLMHDLLVLMVAPNPKPTVHGKMLTHSMVASHTPAQRHLVTFLEASEPHLSWHFLCQMLSEHSL